MTLIIGIVEVEYRRDHYRRRQRYRLWVIHASENYNINCFNYLVLAFHSILNLFVTNRIGKLKNTLSPLTFHALHPRKCETSYFVEAAGQ